LECTEYPRPLLHLSAIAFAAKAIREYPKPVGIPGIWKGIVSILSRNCLTADGTDGREERQTESFALLESAILALPAGFAGISEEYIFVRNLLADVSHEGVRRAVRAADADECVAAFDALLIRLLPGNSACAQVCRVQIAAVEGMCEAVAIRVPMLDNIVEERIGGEDDSALLAHVGRYIVQTCEDRVRPPVDKLIEIAAAENERLVSRVLEFETRARRLRGSSG
jgi:hypothetical protein